MIVYARTRGAFRSLIADIRSSGGGSVERAINRHLNVPTQPSGLPAIMVVSQAIGVLIARGRTPADALDELNDQAAITGLARIDIARIVLQTMEGLPKKTNGDRDRVGGLSR